MALTVKLDGKPPEGHIRISEDQAKMYLHEIIDDWPNRKDVAFLRKSVYITGFATVLSSVLLHREFGRFFRTRRLARLAYLPVVGAPLLFNSGIHNLYITNSIILEKNPCIICLGWKGAAMQFGTSIFYPCIISPMICIVLARKNMTYFIPKLSEGKKILNLVKQVWHRVSPLLMKLTAFNLLLGGFVATQEYLNFNHLKKGLKEMEITKDPFLIHHQIRTPPPLDP